MWKKLSVIAALAAGLAAGPALAQQQSGGTTDKPSASSQKQSKQTMQSAKELKGQAVYSSDGEKVGEVTEVKEGSGGNVESIHVDVGEFLGIGAKTVKIRSGQFSHNNNRVELTMQASEVESLPEAMEQ
jgi:sporulation protein YlmC with PRC-barrel domain